MKKNEISPAADRLAVIEKIKEYDRLGGEYFFRDVEPDPPAVPLRPDDVDYLRRKFSSKFKTAIALLIEHIAKLAIRRKFKISVVGKENLDLVSGGAIITSNHFAVNESVAVKTALDSAKRRRKFFKVIREGNFAIPGFFGFLLKNCRTLPLSSDIHTMKLFDEAVSQILENGDAILVYPEQAMWWKYPKPRDYKIGAFHYAAKNNAPIVPCFVTMKKLPTVGKNGFHDTSYTVHVMKPYYPDPDKSTRENARDMLEYNKRVCREKYEEVYGVPLTYGDYECELLPTED